MNTEWNCEKIVYTHILANGKTMEKHYGKLFYSPISLVKNF